MNQRLAAIELVLDDILSECIKSPMFTKTNGGAPADDPDAAAAIRRLENLESRLQLAIRELKNRQHFVEWTRDRAVLKTREARYSAKQSAKDRLGGISKLLQKASSISVLLQDLLARSGSIGLPDAVAAVIGGPIQKTIEAQAKGEKAKAESTDAGDHLTGTLILIVALISALIRRKSS